MDNDSIDKSDNTSQNDVAKNKSDLDTQQSQPLEEQDKDATSRVEDTNEVESYKKENVTDDICKIDNKKDDTDDENDIIHGTPPTTYSPSTKGIYSTSEKVGCKRKAEYIDKPATKLLRSSSCEDALSIEKNKFSNDDSHRSENSDDSQLDTSRNCTIPDIVIEETQDVEGEEFTQPVVKNSDILNETKDDKNCESCPVQKCLDKNENNAQKSCEINQNETISNPITSDVSINITATTTVTTATATTTTTMIATSTNEDSQEENVLNDTVTKISDETEPTEKKDSESTIAEVTVQKDPNLDASVKSSKDAIEERSDISINKEENIGFTSKPVDDNLQNKNITNKEVVDKIAISKQQPVKTSTTASKSRMSIEVVFDKSMIPQEKKKPTELVEIDEDGEKIVLDSSQDNSMEKIGEKDVFDTTNAETIYKSCYESKGSSDFSYKSVNSTKESSVDSKLDKRHINGSSESKKCDTDGTASVESDIFSNEVHSTLLRGDNVLRSMNKEMKTPTSISKDSDNVDLLSVSDNEHDVSLIDDNIKSKSDLSNTNLLAKALQVEKEVGVYVRLKCLLHVDESTKEFLNKELMSVHCEPMVELPSTRHKTEDTSASLADISGNDNKDGSPGSVNSNPQLFHLNPSRLSFLSTISSTSSASSAASLVAKLAAKDTHFPLPRGPAKHAKKSVYEIPSAAHKQVIDESYERLTKEWKNNHLLVTTILSYLNAELNTIDTYNLSNERIDDVLQKIRCSTPEEQGEAALQTTTPKSSRKNRAPKRPRSKNTRTGVQTNGMCKISSKDLISAQGNNDTSSSRKKSKTDKADIDVPSNNTTSFTKDMSQTSVNDELVGKKVFAKWSDNNYYPGTVTEKVKLKYKVNFYDGKNKLLIEDFIIPIPKTLKEGLSVYATTAEDDYGSCGIIVDVQDTSSGIYYAVETDEGEKLQVQVKDIFLSSDQAQVLKEEVGTKTSSLPSTPKHLSQITLDNMVDGKRRSKRIATPSFSTPKSKIAVSSSADKSIAEPSVSGIVSKTKKRDSSENESKSSDSNLSIKDESVLSGVQPEIIGTPNEQIVKGPQHRIKGKPRNKKKVENEETIATLGPIPDNNSTIFKGMSFILTCASLEVLDRFQGDSKDSGSETGTENEEEWVRRPFVRDRLKTQIEAGKGKIYEEFDLIPKEEYKNTKLITNVPNVTAKSLLCLSVGIPAYNHNWIIQCCQEGKLVNPAGWSLPVGWSLDKQSYVEVFQRPSNKPLTQVIVIIPIIESDKQFTSFWRQICENAGAVVLLVDSSESMEGFAEGAVVVTNCRCPPWVVVKASELQLPLLSTTWIVQCLIEGKICPYDSQMRYKYNYIQN
ncbi:hypothetical protein KPH14_001106 [Odynerus spinipes]|uniref:BRCT domain-containing protein n=1 Tax=Odynerus spinipes TaxID=1348599 RepID=A0AAD9RDQ2_9HYME|nr:hypothetical protein KPH14_001106 [Odynerus spinipes]